MKTVRFTSHYGIYNPGEVAGFQTDHADVLIGLGVAVSEGDAVATAEAAAEEAAAKAAAEEVAAEEAAAEEVAAEEAAAKAAAEEAAAKGKKG